MCPELKANGVKGQGPIWTCPQSWRSHNRDCPWFPGSVISPWWWWGVTAQKWLIMSHILWSPQIGSFKKTIFGVMLATKVLPNILFSSTQCQASNPALTQRNSPGHTGLCSQAGDASYKPVPQCSKPAENGAIRCCPTLPRNCWPPQMQGSHVRADSSNIKLTGVSDRGPYLPQRTWGGRKGQL